MCVDSPKKPGKLPRFIAAWEAFASAIADIVLLVRRGGEIIAANRAPFGFDADDVIGRNLFDFAPADQRQYLRDSLEGIFQGDVAQVRELPTQLPDGSIRWFATHTGLMWEDSQPVAATVVLRDI